MPDRISSRAKEGLSVIIDPPSPKTMIYMFYRKLGDYEDVPIDLIKKTKKSKVVGGGIVETLELIRKINERKHVDYRAIEGLASNTAFRYTLALEKQGELPSLEKALEKASEHYIKAHFSSITPKDVAKDILESGAKFSGYGNRVLDFLRDQNKYEKPKAMGFMCALLTKACVSKMKGGMSDGAISKLYNFNRNRFGILQNYLKREFSLDVLHSVDFADPEQNWLYYFSKYSSIILGKLREK